MQADVTGSPSCGFLERVADNDAVAEELYNRVDVRRQEQLARVRPDNTHGLY